MSQLVTLERHDAVAVLTLNRPEAGNTINLALARELEQQVDAASNDPTVRCIVLTGAGKLFCGGGDVAAMAAAGDEAGAMLLELATTLHRSVVKLATMARPLMVLVNGPAAGAGLSLSISGDVVLAARNASFLAAYSSVGLTPDGGMSWLLPRLVGLRRAQEIIIGGRRLKAEEAEAIGLVTRVVDEGDLLAEGLAQAQLLANGPVAATVGARQLLAISFANDLASHLELEAQRIAQAGSTLEAREGVSAFVERRKPDFRRIQS